MDSSALTSPTILLALAVIATIGGGLPLAECVQRTNDSDTIKTAVRSETRRIGYFFILFRMKRDFLKAKVRVWLLDRVTQFRERIV